MLLQAEKANSAKQTQLQLLNRANTMKNLNSSAGNSASGSSNDVNSVIQQVPTISDDEKFKQVMKIADNEIQVVLLFLVDFHYIHSICFKY
jgi:uncharacterized sporulation protein YeaH/YhbH (DUF444 family)